MLLGRKLPGSTTTTARIEKGIVPLHTTSGLIVPNHRCPTTILNISNGLPCGTSVGSAEGRTLVFDRCWGEGGGSCRDRGGVETGDGGHSHWGHQPILWVTISGARGVAVELWEAGILTSVGGIAVLYHKGVCGGCGGGVGTNITTAGVHWGSDSMMKCLFY